MKPTIRTSGLPLVPNHRKPASSIDERQVKIGGAQIISSDNGNVVNLKGSRGPITVLTALILVKHPGRAAKAVNLLRSTLCQSRRWTSAGLSLHDTDGQTNVEVKCSGTGSGDTHFTGLSPVRATVTVLHELLCTFANSCFLRCMLLRASLSPVYALQGVPSRC